MKAHTKTSVALVSIVSSLSMGCGSKQPHTRVGGTHNKSVNKTSAGRTRASVFGIYAGSEAEATRTYFLQRRDSGVYLENVLFGTENVVTNYIPPDQVRGFIIHEEGIARQLRVTLGTTLSQQYIQDHLDEDSQDLIFSNVCNGVEQNDDAAPNPAYDQRPTNTQFQTYIDHLRNTINDRINTLNRNHGGYYQNPANQAGMGTNIYNNAEHGRIFLAIMNATASNNEEAFLNEIVNYATLFGPGLTEAKRGFIDTFSYLFVTKRFPSEGIRNRYSHYLFRCGGIY